MKLSSLFNPTYGIIRSVIALLLGLAFVIWPDIAVNASVRVLGAAMILVGGISLGINYLGKERLGAMFAVSGIIAVVFGIILLAFPDFFVELQGYLFGALMIFFSIGQIVMLLTAGKFTKVKFTFYVVPILLFIGGVALLAKPYKTIEALFVMFGIALIVYAIYEFIVALRFRKVFKENEKEAIEAAAEEAEAEVLESKPLDEAAAAVEDAVEAAEAGDVPEE